MYIFDEYKKTSSGTLRTTPEKANPSARVAVVVHLFYPDLWDEIEAYLHTWKMPYDLYVTVPEHTEVSVVQALMQRHPSVRIFAVENRGRDVLPFLLVMRHIGLESYEYICKLHSKKTGGSALGDVWRRLLYFDLIGSDETVRRIVAMFDEDESVGMVTGKYTILDSRLYDYGNTAKIERLIDAAGYLFDDHYLFAGGTMFWVRASLLRVVMELFERGVIEFEEERGQIDHTVAHALERFFGIVVKVEGKRIAPAPTRYSRLDDATLDALASLVLSQQYHGKDAFAHQNRIIRQLQERVETQRQRIETLEELADLKRRTKKALKAYTPKPIWRILQLAKKAVWTLRHNPAVLRKVWFYLKRGEFKHIIDKIKEKSEANLDARNRYTPIAPRQIFGRFLQSDYTLADEVIDIVIPVYNGYEYLPKLFDSIAKHTTSPYRLIVVHDAGTDERVLPFLKARLADFKDAVLIEHKTNVGFVKSVNEAVAMGTNHVVILNTDTEVPAFWLERLMYPIVHMDNVASTTPFTNAGTIASFPKFLEDNPMFGGLDVETLDRVFRLVNPKAFYEEVPTGVGFCMGINRRVVDAIGMFDEEAFGKGYGEENDWCQRAIKAGWRNILVPNLFVYHKHGGSFSSEEKARLLRENTQKLLSRHPDYEKQVHAYIARDPHKTLRDVLVCIAASRIGSGVVLMFDHALGGGANIYAEARIRAYEKQGRRVLRVAYDFYNGIYTLRLDYAGDTYAFRIQGSDDLEAFLEPIRIEEIFINSLVSYFDIERIAALVKKLKEMYRAALIVPVHDYFPICPDYTLLDETGSYCGVPEDTARCQACMTHNTQEWRSFFHGEVHIDAWREMWGDILQRADEILCFSEASKAIMRRAYPTISEARYRVVPHRIDPLPRVTLSPKAPHEPLTIGVLGAINHAKGASILKALLALFDERACDAHIVVIGTLGEPIRHKRLRVTGRYKRDELPALVETHGIDLFFIPSIWPETFSYTTQEVMAMGLPLAVFDLGAPAERVKAYDKGMVIGDISAHAAYDVLCRFRTHRNASV